MEKLIISLLLSLFLVTSSFAAPFIYFNWSGEKHNNTKIILLGLPDSPIEADFNKATNPDNPNDDQYYKADYDLVGLADGDYTLTGKIIEPDSIVYTDNEGKTHIIQEESNESDPFLFDKGVPGSVSNMELNIQ